MSSVHRVRYIAASKHAEIVALGARRASPVPGPAVQALSVTPNLFSRPTASLHAPPPHLSADSLNFFLATRPIPTLLLTAARQIFSIHLLGVFFSPVLSITRSRSISATSPLWITFHILSAFIDQEFIQITLQAAESAAGIHPRIPKRQILCNARTLCRVIVSIISSFLSIQDRDKVERRIPQQASSLRPTSGLVDYLVKMVECPGKYYLDPALSPSQSFLSPPASAFATRNTFSFTNSLLSNTSSGDDEVAGVSNGARDVWGVWMLWKLTKDGSLPGMRLKVYMSIVLDTRENDAPNLGGVEERPG
ncbi:hypothetical protein GYMLUDRAFT_236007 [Collybiopsis luxurians FD-317 M1]|nr:hypothetical protein GYMLUDRAFT_236007 [Collybiopsis luxurians FD-317 M1]